MWRVVEGKVTAEETIRMLATGVDVKPIEVGIFAPTMKPVPGLTAGEVGYIATGLKTVHDARVGDTITQRLRAGQASLAGLPCPQADGFRPASIPPKQTITKPARSAR